MLKHHQILTVMRGHPYTLYKVPAEIPSSLAMCTPAGVSLRFYLITVIKYSSSLQMGAHACT